MQRTDYCGLITEKYINQQVTIKGWVARRRDLGGVIFLDVRDRYGIVQVTINPDNPCFQIASELKHEYVIAVTGMVIKRPNPNREIPTGQIEIIAETIEVLNVASPLPILIDDPNTSETNRMTHRIIDLRSQKMQHNIMFKHKLTSTIRHFLDNLGFIDIETPYLTLSTPGGARDFLVPSRVHKGSFYALPQSPQIFKQLLMVAGFDRYYQIVRCFRDEDFRADRQPEFTQVDIETTFLNEEEIRDIMEGLLLTVFRQLLNISLPVDSVSNKLRVLTHKDAMYYYGSDKPDLRIPLKFTDLTDIFKNTSFSVFKDVATRNDGRIVALKLSNIQLSRKELDAYTKYISTYYGAKGLASIKVIDTTQVATDGLQSSLSKFLSSEELTAVIAATQAVNGDLILIGADKTKVVNEAMGALRLKIGHDKNLYTSAYEALWVVDFPLFEYNEETGQYVAAHHAFTAPKDEHLALLQTNPEKCLAKAYDLVLNGSEIGGGSVRIHRQDIQSQVFTAMHISKEEARQKFGFLLDNLQFGAPPHGGLAFGLDRLAAIMCQANSIRDVIAFPKSTGGQCLLTKAPSTVEQSQLDELALRVTVEE